MIFTIKKLSRSDFSMKSRILFFKFFDIVNDFFQYVNRENDSEVR